MKNILTLCLLAVSSFGCSNSDIPPNIPFDLPSAVRGDLDEIVNHAVANKTSLADFRRQISSRYGTIYYFNRYTNSSNLTKDQTGLEEIIRSSQLRDGESLLAIGLEGDQSCYVVCDQDDILVRNALPSSQ